MMEAKGNTTETAAKTVDETAFSEYVTSTAFRIALSQPQIKAMRAIVNNEIEESSEGFATFHPYYLGSMRALQRKGLVNSGGDGLTRAGAYVLELVKMAGI